MLLGLHCSTDGSVVRTLNFVSLPDQAVPPYVRWQMFHGGWEPVSANLTRQMLYHCARSDVLQGRTSPCGPLARLKCC